MTHVTVKPGRSRAEEQGMNTTQRITAIVLSTVVAIGVAAGPASACARLTKWCMAGGQPTQSTAWEGRVIR